MNAKHVEIKLGVVGLKMHELANEIIGKNINEVISGWDFEERKKANPNGCICYEQNKKCHDLENLNCFFCYCPNYDKSVKEGKCKINSPKGKYINNHEGKILDCSDCDFPHKKENAIKLLEILFK
jgi:Zn-finger protein